ncbi:MAG: PAS domain S-box protein [Methanosarcinaceae archaeon]
MSGSSTSLRELIDVDELQSIQDSFAGAVGISSVILSPEGEPLTKFTNPTGFCSLIQSTEKGKERCFRSFFEMGKTALLSKEPEIFYCFAHGGHFVAPIMIDGEHKGTMFAGQFIPEKFSSEQLQNLEEIAHEIGIDKGALVKEAEKMRVVGEDVIRNYSSLLFEVVEVIARRGAQAAELERRVQERTAELEREVVERKLAEEALQKERDRAQHYLDIAGVMFLAIGADRKVILINRKGCEILGYKEEEEITGKDWFDNFVPKGLRDEVARVFGLLMAGEIEPVEYYENPVLTKHGEERIVAWHNTILRDEQGRIYASLASGEDITEQKRVDEGRRESEEKFRILAENSIDCIWLLDAKLIFTYLSPSLERIMGFKPEQWVGTKMSSHFKKKEFLKVGFLAVKSIKNYATFTPVTFETKMLNSKNDEVDVEISSKVLLNSQGKLIGLQGTTKDITERKSAEKAIGEGEEKLRMITTSANDAILMMDPEGNISYWNKAAEQMFGYTEEEVIGKDLHVLLVPERFHAGFLKGFEGFKETGRGAALGKTLELVALGKDGKEFPVEISLSAVKLDGRWNAIGLIRDTTERKAAEEELKKRADELGKFNKLAVGRELKMIELKKEINALLGESGKEPGYKIVGES